MHVLETEAPASKQSGTASGYRKLKRAMDVALSGAAILALSPVLAGIAVAVKLDSPGPVLFKQKRVGKDKQLFEIWKFRSMRADTPKDMPTHMLNNPEAFITRTGRFLRKTSLDELPQLFNILRGQMSIVGPRPALWNQEDLIAERDRYGANNVTPGLTGWAQINGRDELEIPVKARFDGEYVEKMGLDMDIKCFFGTIGSVLSHDGVVEGGTGEMRREGKTTDGTVGAEKLNREICTGAAVTGAAAVAGIGALAALSGRKKGNRHTGWLVAGAAAAVAAGVTVYANVLRAQSRRKAPQTVPFRETKQPAGQKRVLITGANSYIGMSVDAWLGKHPDSYRVDTLDMLDDSWRDKDFAEYDTILHVAGIAHVDITSISEERRQLYYRVNRDLAVEVAEKAKASGVKQFIFMSTMNVYAGCGESRITAGTQPKPVNCYGDSKWQADQRIRAMENEDFKVAVLRPPMIYGKDCKGNFQELTKLARKLPAFPIVENQRSMLHIDNLCQFIKLIIDNEDSGVFFPQNGEYTNTSDMVEMIAESWGRRIVMLPFTNTAVKLLEKAPGRVGTLATKAFGSCAYDMAMSAYPEDYRVHSLRESVALSKGERR